MSFNAENQYPEGTARIAPGGFPAVITTEHVHVSSILISSISFDGVITITNADGTITYAVIANPAAGATVEIGPFEATTGLRAESTISAASAVTAFYVEP